MKGIIGLSAKIMPILSSFIGEISKLSWLGCIAMLCIAGILMMTGNEFGAKKVCKNAVYGWAIIQVANMLL